ncbi:STAS domain-containing protein [Nonomuraea basaltis]|uniref:STAS domain-containing protein n=1 Tax=Nonomuraea basaltis TaxID=2495887 RepID=UPI00110C5785|nr:STAS domain-containing protein [Nonomuraea basaltis]TMR98950.1 STAS domain-containing protein [Nonomuraea basaltis]
MSPEFLARILIGGHHMQDLTFAVQRLPGVCVISVAGEIDAATAGQLDRYVQRSRRMPGEHMVIDLSEAGFLGSAGLRVLLNTHAFARQHGGALHLAAPHPTLARIMEITQAHTVLHVHATVEQAVIAALQQSSAPERTLTQA